LAIPLYAEALIAAAFVGAVYLIVAAVDKKISRPPPVYEDEHAWMNGSLIEGEDGMMQSPARCAACMLADPGTMRADLAQPRRGCPGLVLPSDISTPSEKHPRRKVPVR